MTLDREQKWERLFPHSVCALRLNSQLSHDKLVASHSGARRALEAQVTMVGRWMVDSKSLPLELCLRQIYSQMLRAFSRNQTNAFQGRPSDPRSFLYN